MTLNQMLRVHYPELDDATKLTVKFLVIENNCLEDVVYDSEVIDMIDDELNKMGM